MHQLADLAGDRLAVLVVGFHRGAQAAPRDHPGPHRQQRARTDEPGAQVGAAGKGAEQQVGLDRLVHPAERLGRQRRPGRADGAQRRQADLGARAQPRLHAGHQVGRADAQVGDAVLGGQPPQPVRLRVRGAAVVQHDRHPGQQAAGQVVPHHPAGRGVPGEHVARAQVLVERERLEVLEDDAAVTVHDRLRQAGGAGGIDHPERVRERHLFELRLVLGCLFHPGRPSAGCLQAARRRRPGSPGRPRTGRAGPR